MITTPITLFAHKCIRWNEKLLCFAKNLNLLFSVDLQNGNLEMIDAVPSKNILSEYLFGSMFILNNNLILGPNKAKKIWTYDLNSKQWDDLSLNKYNGWGNGITQIYKYKNFLYLIGSGYPAIVCLDLSNNTCSYIEEPYKDVSKRNGKTNLLYFRARGVQVHSTLYLASCSDNYVLQFDMDTQKHHWIKVGDNAYTYSEITWDGTHFWLSPKSNCDIVKWDGKEKTEILPLPSELKSTIDMYAWGACFDGDHIVFPCMSHPKSIKIDIKKNKYEIYNQQYSLYTRLDNGIVVNQTPDGELSVKIGNTVQTYYPSINIEQLKQFYEERGLPVFDCQTLYHEAPSTSPLSLENYLTFLKTTSQNKPLTDGSIGKTIWGTIR